MIQPKKLSEKVVSLLMPCLSSEFMAFYSYQAASNYLQGEGFKKLAEYFSQESKSELGHADILQKYLVDWNVCVELPVIEKPKIEFTSAAECIEMAYGLEYNLLKKYNETMDEIFSLEDIYTFDFLKQFLEIQVKSVAEYSDMLNLLKGVDTSDKFQMLMLEKKLV